MTNFYLKSLGCKQNILEGQIITQELNNAGYQQVDKIELADIYILNSCSVTSHSDSQIHYLLNQAKRKNKDIKLILTGCCAQTIKYKKQNDSFDYSNIDLILGNSEKINIAKYIEQQGISVKDTFENNTFENKFLYNPQSTRVSVKIQDGCNNRCSYCIIPYARGNSRSNSIENIIEQINILTSLDIKEIVLTGIHIGQWGLEFNKTLIDLLKEIEKTKIPRYRLSSLYPNEINDDLIEFLKKSEKFCPHFHLSLQSLCDKTLSNMNRKYSAKNALDVIKKLNENFKNPYLGCDIIVGFPNETNDDFEITYNNLKNSDLSSIHCFPYSPRENTPASKLPQIQNSIKTQRAKKIAELSKILHKNFLNKNKNSKAEILIQKKSEKTGKYSAITRNYIKIDIEDERENLRHTLKIVDLSKYKLR